jgi:hypothetical protein
VAKHESDITARSSLGRRKPLRAIGPRVTGALVAIRTPFLALRISRLAQYLFVLLAKPLVPPVLALIAAAALGSRTALEVAAVAGVAYVVLRWLSRARRRVVVQEFVDLTVKGANEQAKDKAPNKGSGLSTLFLAELHRLGSLYSSGEERRAISTVATHERAIDASIQVDDIAALLQEPVTAESKVSVGPITLPLGSALSLLGLLARGPRLIASVHEQDGRPVVIAQLIGRAPGFLWRVEGSRGGV